MVLYLVYQLTGVLQSHAHGNALRLNLNLCFSQISVNVSGRVTCGKNNRTPVLFVGYAANNSLSTKNQLCHLRLKMHFATTADDGVSHRLNYLWQSVGSYMWMRIGQNSRRGSMLTEHIQNFVRVATFLAACVQLAVRVSTCSTLTKAVIALSIHFLRFRDQRQVLLSLMHVLAPLQHDGAQSQFYQTQGSKQAARTSSHHDHLRLSLHVGIFRPLVFVVVRLLVHIYANFQIHVYLSLTGINTAFQDSHAVDRPHVNALFVSQIGLQSVLLCRHLRHNPYLIFVCHTSAKVQHF